MTIVASSSNIIPCRALNKSLVVAHRRVFFSVEGGKPWFVNATAMFDASHAKIYPCVLTAGS